MRIEVMDCKKTRIEAQKYILKKLPLASRVAQFNSFIEGMHLEYIEYKLLSYEISIKRKNGLKKPEIKKDRIDILVNTYNGRSESINEMPKTSKKYVVKSYIRNATINEEDLTRVVKDEVIKFLKDKRLYKSLDKFNIQSIELVDIKSIYKACWIAEFRGRNILIDTE